MKKINVKKIEEIISELMELKIRVNQTSNGNTVLTPEQASEIIERIREYKLNQIIENN